MVLNSNFIIWLSKLDATLPKIYILRLTQIQTQGRNESQTALCALYLINITYLQCLGCIYYGVLVYLIAHHFENEHYL